MQDFAKSVYLRLRLHIAFRLWNQHPDAACNTGWLSAYCQRQRSRTRAYRKSSPSILVMQSAQDRTAQNASRGLGGT